MPLAETMFAEFESQAPVTRKFLERLPENKLTWKPHEKSMTAGQLAFHLAFVPGGVVRFVQQNPAQAPDFKFPQPVSVREILNAFDESIATVKSLLPPISDASMHEIWRLMSGDKESSPFPAFSSFATSCSITGISIAASFASTCAFSMWPSPQVGVPVRTSRPCFSP